MRSLCRSCGVPLEGGSGCAVCGAVPVVRAAPVVAEDVIRRVLGDGEWRSSASVVEAAGHVGISRRSLQRRAKELGVEVRRTSAVPPRSEWRLVVAEEVIPAVITSGELEPVAETGSIEPVALVHDDGFTITDEFGQRYSHGPGRQGLTPPPSWPGGSFSFETERF